MEHCTPVARVVACALAISLVAPLAARAAAPPPGTRIVTPFCGTVFDATLGMRNHGVEVGQPYTGFLDLTQRDHDFEPSPNSTQWQCTEEPEASCGTLSVDLQTFVPPQTDPAPSLVSGEIVVIDQSAQSYDSSINIDDFVTGPAALGALGLLEFELFCVDCGQVNDVFNISPDFRDNIGSFDGNIVISVQVPGIGSSGAPPQGNPQIVRASVSRLGGGCNSFLPATSSGGLIGLAALMIATTLFFSRGRTRAT